ncbi:MAG: hypothetical protein ACJ8DQ_21495, partial [Xanthobacteraceae bacterium]
LARTESRGAHFRLDHPETDDKNWRVVTRLQLSASGALELHADPVKQAPAARVAAVAAK